MNRLNRIFTSKLHRHEIAQCSFGVKIFQLRCISAAKILKSHLLIRVASLCALPLMPQGVSQD